MNVRAYLIHIEIAMAKYFWIDPRIKKSRNQEIKACTSHSQKHATRTMDFVKDINVI